MEEDDLPYCIETHVEADLPELDQLEIRRVVASVLRAEGCASAEISVALMDDNAVRALNARYLDHDYDTDVLAFDLSDGSDAAGGGPEGQVIVNVDMARRQADKRSADPVPELMLYIVHGCLHLLGYDDVQGAEADRMHRREDALLEQLGYGRVYDSSREDSSGHCD